MQNFLIVTGCLLLAKANAISPKNREGNVKPIVI